MPGSKSCSLILGSRCHSRIALARYYASSRKHPKKAWAKGPIRGEEPRVTSAGLQADAFKLSQACKSHPVRIAVRNEVRERLTNAIRSIDSDYHVISTGIDKYGVDLNLHPFEFGIIPATVQDEPVISPLQKVSTLAKALNKMYRHVTVPDTNSDLQIETASPSSRNYPRYLRLKDEKMDITLSLPSPYTEPRINLLKSVYGIKEHKDLLALATVWLASVEIKMTHEALALLIGCFLHERVKSHASLDELFMGWLRFNSDLKFRIPQAIFTSENEPYFKEQVNLNEGPIRIWTSRAFAIQDPFVPTKNHADNMSLEEWERLIFLSRITYRGLVDGKGFTRYFGFGIEPNRIDKAYQTSTHHLWGSSYQKTNALLRRGSKEGQTTSIQDHEEKPKPNDPDEAFLHELLQVPPELILRHQRTLNNVTKAVQTKYNWVTVRPSGGICYGTAYPESEFYMSIFDPQLPHGNPAKFLGPDYPLYRLPNLRQLLVDTGFAEVKMVTAAVTPLVQFIDPETKLRCEISINERLGLYSTQMIKDYCDIFPPMRSIIQFLKAWAKPLGLNCPTPHSGAPQTFCDYSLALMTIALLQKRNLLPNFQEGFEGLFNDPAMPSRRLPKFIGKEPEGTFWFKRPRLLCDTRWTKRPGVIPSNMIPPTRNLIQDWFKFYGQEFDYVNGKITFRANTEEKDHGDFNEYNKRHIKQYFRLQDPFIIDKNVIKHVGRKALKHFTAECERALEQLENGSPLAALIAPDQGNPLIDPTKVKVLTRKKLAKLKQKQARFEALGVNLPLPLP